MSRGSRTETSPNRRRNDLFLLLGILLIVAVLGSVYVLTRKEGAYAIVLKGGAEIGRYSLSGTREVPIAEGDTVTNVLVIKNGKAQITEAVCPDQICVEHRPISKSGETIVCLPNEIVIKIIALEYGDTPDIVS